MASTRLGAAAVASASLVLATAFGVESAAAGLGDETPPPIVIPASGIPEILPIDDISGVVEELVFSEANLDGSAIAIGDKEFRLDANVLFRFDQATLTPKAASAIALVVGRLKTTKAHALQVDGYTDSTGSDSYNLALSTRRAEAVKRALAAALGNRVTITASGHGEADPVADNDTKAGQALNRRVTVRVTDG